MLNAADPLFLALNLGIGLLTAFIIIKYLLPAIWTKSTPQQQQLDPKLSQIAIDIVKSHTQSMRSGRLTSTDHISPVLLPEIKQKISEFQTIIDSGIQIDCQAQNLQVQFHAETDKTITLKVLGNFTHEYLQQGRHLLSPTRDHFAPSDHQPSSEVNHYLLKFLKNDDGTYQLIGLTDSIMGNDLGDI